MSKELLIQKFSVILAERAVVTAIAFNLIGKECLSAFARTAAIACTSAPKDLPFDAEVFFMEEFTKYTRYFKNEIPLNYGPGQEEHYYARTQKD
jgi:hypothetical protein